MNIDHDKEKIKDAERHDVPAQEDDWLDTSKACPLGSGDETCEACQ